MNKWLTVRTIDSIYTNLRANRIKSNAIIVQTVENWQEGRCDKYFLRTNIEKSIKTKTIFSRKGYALQ